jgi:TM2 domain-containing membrane protein YozV
MEEPKDVTLAYAFWLSGMFGIAGLQRIYLGRYFSGFFFLCTWGCLGVGQLFDLALIPGMVKEENLKQALAGGSAPELLHAQNVPTLVYSSPTAATLTEPIHVKILRVCRDLQGATLSDCVIETGAEIAAVKAMVSSLISQELLYVHNRESDGTVVYIAV